VKQLNSFRKIKGIFSQEP